MKTILFNCLLFLSHITLGQNYAPFSENNPKRFHSNSNMSENDFYFYPILTTQNGDTTIFHQYLRQSAHMVDASGTGCEGWGGGGLQPLADTTWLGREITFNTSTNVLSLKNKLNEQIEFNFALPIGDSAIFYQTATEAYYLRYDSHNQENVIDSLNWVKTFTIWKYNDMGFPLASALNGFELKLSEELGLVSFIDCNEFPFTEQGVVLMGQLHPTIGYYQMTYDEAFPWVIGDSIEVRGSNSDLHTGLVVRRTTSLRLITIQDRIETVDSVWIYLNIDGQVTYYPAGIGDYPNSYNISYPNPIIYKKGENIFEEPNNMTYTFGTSFTYDSIDYCGVRERASSSESYIQYCDSCDCFSSTDGFGQTNNSVTYLEGLGKKKQHRTDSGPTPSSGASAEIIYSNVGGIQCGTYEPLGIENLTLDASFFPNPVISIIEIQANFEFDKVEIFNANGKLTTYEFPMGFNAQIEISDLATGTYFVRVIGTDGRQKTKLFLKQ